MPVYYKVTIKGIVQGVGFRPFIYREAVKRKLNGYVKNTGPGVEIIVNKKDFIKILKNKPPLAKIDSYKLKKIELNKNFEGFSIIKSSKSKGISQIPADIFLCNDCLKELRDKQNRRFNYYFITCTNCGPRFSMIFDYPYDRPFTSMDEFKMCDECRKEYTDPLNRRYHAQTIACKNCGPELYFIDKTNDTKTKNKSINNNAIKSACEKILQGEIVAIKGVGGFHLCCRGDNATIKKLRMKKINRANKPFAIMVRDLKMLKRIAKFNNFEKKLIQSLERPILILDKKNPDSFKQASELSSIGVMLPYTALHYLLFDFIDEPLIMTSANISGQPLSIDEKTLSGIDYILTHTRKIINRCDDSVIKIIEYKINNKAENHPLFIRRSRGFTPSPFCFNQKRGYKQTLSLGAELKNAFAVVNESKVFLSQYIGTTSKLMTFEFFKDSLQKFIKFTGLKPEQVACDMHPLFNTTLFAEKFSYKNKIRLKKIQHHHAHVAGVALEYNLRDYIGIACDGTGYGIDGKIWGGEIFDVNENSFKRISHLEEHPMIGENSINFPKKMLVGILSKFMDKNEILDLRLFNKKETLLYLNQLKENFNIMKTSSTGRVLDAVAALLGLCDLNTYEGRAPMILESFTGNSKSFELNPVIEKINSTYILKTTPLFEFIIQKLKKNATIQIKKRLAKTAQDYLARGLYKIAQRYNIEKYNGKKKIVFSGGVSYNKFISAYMLKKGVLLNKFAPPGDGGISFGQSCIANLN
ncbi:carbamoyltransferase HypF [Candidatus Woesearchaeota archaeon]|nr:carbamoyltransferase HypF [Candidatus Woesearchaeota archaeon]